MGLRDRLESWPLEVVVCTFSRNSTSGPNSNIKLNGNCPFENIPVFRPHETRQQFRTSLWWLLCFTTGLLPPARSGVVNYRKMKKKSIKPVDIVFFFHFKGNFLNFRSRQWTDFWSKYAVNCNPLNDFAKWCTIQVSNPVICQQLYPTESRALEFPQDFNWKLNRCCGCNFGKQKGKSPRVDEWEWSYLKWVFFGLKLPRWWGKQ